jgi:hypothetical protein
MTRARDLANLADGDFAGTWTVDSLASDGNVSIANGDLTITSTDAASTTPSPVLTLARDGASPEDNDLMGQIVFKMDDDAGNLSTFARIEVVATDVSNGSEDARIDFIAAKDDSFSAALSIAGQNVGIGTSTIGDKLVVQGASSATASIVIQDPTANDYGTHLSYDDANSKAIFGGLTNGTKNPALSVARDASGGIDIDSNGNVGIGCTPDQKLHVKGTIETQATNSTNGWQLYTYTDNTFRVNYNGAGADEIVINSSGNVGIGTDSPQVELHLKDTGGLSRIRLEGTASNADNFEFGQGTTGVSNAGFEIYDVDATTTRFVIDSSGNVLVGAASNNSANAGHGFQPDGFVYHTRDGGAMLRLNRLTSDGAIQQFQKDGSTVGIIGTIGGDTITIGSGDAGLLINQSNDEIIPWDVTSNAARDGLIDLGDASHRFKNFYLSGGVYLGGTGSANLLDDYEEGTFDVTLTTTGGSVTLNSVYNTMSYTKVGRLVTVFGLIITSGVSSPTGAYAHFDTLPFTSANLTEGSGRSGGGVFYFDGTNSHVKPWEISESSTRLSVYLDASTLTSGDDFYFSCTYQAA